MKNLNKWLLSAVLAMVLSNGFGQAQSIKIDNNYVDDIIFQVFAVNDCNDPNWQVVSNVVIPGNSGTIVSPLFDIAVYPNAEWICVRAAVYGENGYIAEDNDYMCSNIINYPALGGMGTNPPTNLSFITWVSSFLVDIN